MKECHETNIAQYIEQAKYVDWEEGFICIKQTLENSDRLAETGGLYKESGNGRLRFAAHSV